MMEKNIFFLGCGKMGSIIAKNLITKNIARCNNIKVLKKSASNKIPGLEYLKNISELKENYSADLVFLCVKPQNSQTILQEFAQPKIFNKNTVFISILAGKKIDFLEKFFGKKAKIVRAMPNLPIEVEQGIFPYFCNENIGKSEAKNLQKIFQNFGLSFALKDEKFFDAITAIFGSGPAYFFLLAEIFCEISCALEIDEKLSIALVKKLILGSALMIDGKEKSFAELRESVTSKGGTTEASINVLLKNSALRKIFQKAINAAVKRSKEISK